MPYPGEDRGPRKDSCTRQRGKTAGLGMVIDCGGTPTGRGPREGVPRHRVDRKGGTLVSHPANRE